MGDQALTRSLNSTTSSKSSLFIAVTLTIAILYFGRFIFIPLALALVFSFLLTPFVSLLEKAHLGRVPSTLTVLALCIVIAVGVGWEVTAQLLEITGHIGDYKENLEQTIRSLNIPRNTALGQATATMRELNKELDAAPGKVATANPSGAKTNPSTSHPIPVQVTAPPTNLVQDVHTLIGPVAGPLETAGIVIIFTAFILIKREDLRNRLIRLGGEGRLTVVTQALDDASRRLSRYLLMQFLVNATYGSIFGVGLYFMKLPHALLWGTLAALLRFVPYIGTLIAAAFPVVMALAVFPGWNHALMIVGLFLILELITANLIEPWLYGTHTGISSLAVLVAAVFWSMLWGPVGLILSTPLTVCLMLAGRYVQRLSFLEVLLGDEPVLSAHELLYQRLLAMDQDEARNLMEKELHERSLQSLYEEIVIPALGLAEEDRHSDAVSERTSEFIYQSMRELIDDLGEQARTQSTTGEAADVAKALSGSQLAKINIICVPARDGADELVGTTLSQLLQQAGHGADYIVIGTVHDMLEQVAQSGCHTVCVSALPPFAVGQARSLCKRIHARFPELAVIVGLWNFAAGAQKAQERIGSSCSDAVATTLSEALLQVRRLSAASDQPDTGKAVASSAK